MQICRRTRCFPRAAAPFDFKTVALPRAPVLIFHDAACVHMKGADITPDALALQVPAPGFAPATARFRNPATEFGRLAESKAS